MELDFFGEDWEERLQLQFFSEKPWKDNAYICSPLNAQTEHEFLVNMYAARAYMLYAKEKLGYLARAPHAFLPMLLCDQNAEERSMALAFGLKLLEDSKILLVCGNRMSHGMRGEIVQAVALGKKIIVFDESLCHEVRKIVVSNQGHRSFVILDGSHPIMANPAPQMQCRKAVRVL